MSAVTGGVSGPAAADPVSGTSPQQVPAPPSESFLAGFAATQAVPTLVPRGINDPSCEPTARRPRPVVLLPGTFENLYDDFGSLAPRLQAMGFCVFGIDYGDDADSLAGNAPGLMATADIRDSAREVAAFVADVRRQTGAEQVDLVGHSQGGVVARQYMRFAGGTDPTDPARNVVRRLVTIGATNHGTSLDGIATLGRRFGLLDEARTVLGTAAIQQVRGSELERTLNAAGDTDPGVDYTVIATRFDEVTTPFASTFLTAGPGAIVHNVLIQDGCQIDRSEHLYMTYGPRTARLVANGLEPALAAPAPCLPKPPIA